jgi:hypothetical protein
MIRAYWLVLAFVPWFITFGAPYAGAEGRQATAERRSGSIALHEMAEQLPAVLVVEQILRSFPEVVEYRMIVWKSGEMDALSVEIEDRLEQPERVAKELQLRLGLKVDVRLVELGSLPRFEGKGKRFLDQR